MLKCLSVKVIKKMENKFKQVDVWKALGITPKFLGSCTEQPAPIYVDIFNWLSHVKYFVVQIIDCSPCAKQWNHVFFR